MILSGPKKYYSRFLQGHEGKLHFAAHSHHFWPDVSRDGHLAYWDDCALTSDHKWDKIFGSVIPTAQRHIADILQLKRPEQITFAPNTHEFGARLLSLFIGKPDLKILTTSSEFHSWNRQITRLEELSQVQVKRVPVTPSLISDLKTELQKDVDIFFISQVFFDSGIALKDDELLDLLQSKKESTLIVVDGYHGFGALPTNLSRLEGKIFYLGGGYKYAQAGEGAAFMVIPEGQWRPAYTGWFAGFGSLGNAHQNQVGYAQDGMSFMGATQDFSGLYRFNAVWDFFKKEGLSIHQIHQHVKSLQEAFLGQIKPIFLNTWGLKPCFHDLSHHGHFLTYEAQNEEGAQAFEKALKSAQVMIDRRGLRVRFGFGLYHDLADVLNLTKTLGDLTEKKR